MKVLFLFGGLPHYYNAILNRLNEINGLEIVVAVPKSKGKAVGEGVFQTDENIKFKVIELEEKQSLYGKPYFANLANALSEETPDAVVVIWPYVLSFLFDRKVKRVVSDKKIKLIYKDIPFRIPYYKDVFSWEGESYYDENLVYEKSNGLFPMFRRITLGLIRKAYLNKMDAHVYYTEESKEIISSYGVDKDKIFVIYNSVDNMELERALENAKNEPPLLPSNEKRIIHVGRLVKWKRVDLLIEAVKSVSEKFESVELLVVGNGPELENLKRLAVNLGIKEKVVFYGAVYDSATMANLMLGSSIYVLAGMGGLSINEAMCYGKPVICSVCDGTEKKLVREGYNGLYFEEGNKNDLADKIKYLFDNPQLIETFGENSKKIIDDEINVDTVIKGYVDAFNYVSEKEKLEFN
ncbi:MAG: glycosyltransferase family 4 protein [Chlorobi bacterium]|nr:glycosyltransferase family 4 protein [Chlorobiota bacterium]